MTDLDDQNLTRRRANITSVGLLSVGVVVWATVSLLTGSLVLGLLYGLLPGVALAVLGRVRILRGGLFTGADRPDSSDRERA